MGAGDPGGPGGERTSTGVVAGRRPPAPHGSTEATVAGTTPTPDAATAHEPAQGPEATRSRRNLQLDILRGVAILLVVGRHLHLDDPPGPVGGVSWAWFRIGWIGVDLFFVLSGFLIGGLLLGELARHGTLNVPRFLVRRGLKLYPPYYVFIGGLVLVPVIKTLVRGGDGLARLSEQFQLYWPNLLFLHTYVGETPAAHTWSLAVEEHFYLLLPLGLLLLARLGRVRWVMTIALIGAPAGLVLRAVAIWSDDRFAAGMSATHLRLDALLFGVAIRAVAQYWPEAFAAARRFRVPLLAAGVALWLPNFFVEPTNPLIRTLGLTGTFVGSGAFLVATFHTRAADFGRGASVVRPVSRLLAGIGVYSYAIYLWHVTVIGMTEDRIVTTMLGVTGTWNGAAWLATATAVTVLSVLVGVVVTKAIDWPVLRFRDRYFPSRSASLPGPEGR